MEKLVDVDRIPARGRGRAWSRLALRWVLGAALTVPQAGTVQAGDAGARTVRTHASAPESPFEVQLDVPQTPGALTLVVRLTNAAARPLWVPAQPTVGTMSADFRPYPGDLELVAIDARGRRVPDLCPPAVLEHRHFLALAPDAALTATARFDPRCFLLTPGEDLRLDVYSGRWAGTGAEAPAPGAMAVASQRLNRKPILVRVPGDFSVVARPAGPPPPPWPEPSATALALAVRPASGDGPPQVALEIENRGREPLWLPAKWPRISHSSPEHAGEASVWLTLIDRQRRLVPFRCSSEFHAPGEFLALDPGQRRTLTVSLERGCYDLAPGEMLTAYLRLQPTRDDPAAPAEARPLSAPVAAHLEAVLVPAVRPSPSAR